MTLAEFVNTIGFKVKDSDVQQVNNTFNQIKGTATRLLGAIGIGFSLANMNQLVEEFTRVKDQIRNSTAELEDHEAVQQKILESATKLRAAYKDTSKMVSNLVKENPQLFPSVDEAIKFNNAATMLFKTAGKSNEEIAGIMEAVNKSFAKGYVDSETLSQLLERSPEAVQLLNKRLGTTSDQLEKMATDGKFTVQDLKAAFVDNAAEIEASFGNVKMTVTDAMTVIRNKWGLWLADTNEAIGLTDSLAKTAVRGFDMVLGVLNRVRNGVVWLSEKLGGANQLLKLVAISAGSIFLALNGSKILTFMTGFTKMLTAANMKTAGIAAGILLLALLVEDFINFMQGNDSLFGTLLEKAGIDVDDFREKMVSVWRGIQTTVLPIIRGFVNGFRQIFGALGAFWGEWGDEIMAVVGTVFGVIGDAIASFVQWVSGSEDAKDILYSLGEALAVVAAAIGLIVGVEKTISGISAAIGFFSSPVGIAVAAILGLILVIGLLVKNWDKIKEAGQKAWAGIVSAWQGAGNWVKTNIVDPVLGFFTGLYDGAVSIFQGIGAWIQGNWQSILLFLINPFAGIFNYLYQNFEGFRNFVDGIVESVSGKASEIKANIVANFESAIAWIKGLPKEALTWGADIIKNLIQGIGNGLNNLGDAVKGVAGKIRDFIGFSEPEEGPLSDFHTYMPDMINLLVKGINAGKPLVKSAISSLAELMKVDGEVDTDVDTPEPDDKPKPRFPGGFRTFAADMMTMAKARVASPVTASTVTNNSTNRSVVQNVEINNEFNGDTAIQRETAKTMDRSAKDATAELARGLAFAK